MSETSQAPKYVTLRAKENSVIAVDVRGDVIASVYAPNAVNFVAEIESHASLLDFERAGLLARVEVLENVLAAAERVTYRESVRKLDALNSESSGLYEESMHELRAAVAEAKGV